MRNSEVGSGTADSTEDEEVDANDSDNTADRSDREVLDLVVDLGLQAVTVA